MQCKIIQLKVELTNLIRYKYKSSAQNEIIKGKIRETFRKNKILKNISNIEAKNIIKFLNKFNNIFHLDIQIYEIYYNDLYYIKFIKHLYKNRKRLLKLKEIANIFKFHPSTICKRLKKLNLIQYFNILDSELELQFKELLENSNINYERSNRNVLQKTDNNGKPELDFYLKDYNIAFEINDVMSHNIKIKNQYYHLNKTLQCKEKGIRLIHLWEWELTDKDL